MKWNEIKWNEMKWNGMKWNEMEWNVMKWNEIKKIKQSGRYIYLCLSHGIYFLLTFL